MKRGRKLFTIVGLIIIAMGAALLWAERGSSLANEHPSTAQPVVTAIPTPKEKMTISGSKATLNPSGHIQVNGQLTNNEAVAHNANIMATFYDKAGKVLGTATGTVNNIDPSQTKPFVLTSAEKLATYYEMRVEVDKLF